MSSMQFDFTYIVDLAQCLINFLCQFHKDMFALKYMCRAIANCNPFSMIISSGLTLHLNHEHLDAGVSPVLSPLQHSSNRVSSTVPPLRAVETHYTCFFRNSQRLRLQGLVHKDLKKKLNANLCTREFHRRRCV